MGPLSPSITKEVPSRQSVSMGANYDCKESENDNCIGKTTGDSEDDGNQPTGRLPGSSPLTPVTDESKEA